MWFCLGVRIRLTFVVALDVLALVWVSQLLLTLMLGSRLPLVLRFPGCVSSFWVMLMLLLLLPSSHVAFAQRT